MTREQEATAAQWMPPFERTGGRSGRLAAPSQAVTILHLRFVSVEITPSHDMW